MKENDKNQLPILYLKEQIDKLVEQIAKDIRDENIALKQKILSLENENLRLLRLLYLIQEEKSTKKGALEYLIKSKKNNLLN